MWDVLPFREMVRSYQHDPVPSPEDCAEVRRRVRGYDSLLPPDVNLYLEVRYVFPFLGTKLLTGFIGISRTQ